MVMAAVACDLVHWAVVCEELEIMRMLIHVHYGRTCMDMLMLKVNPTLM